VPTVLKSGSSQMTLGVHERSSFIWNNFDEGKAEVEIGKACGTTR
jgi:hypothetical protein